MAAMAAALLLFSAAAGGTGELTCRLAADGDTVVLFPTNSAGDAVEVDATTGQRLAGLRAHKRDSLRAVTERAMEYCAAVGAHVVGEPGPCGAVMAQQMWACLSGVFQESFSGAVDEDGSSSRWLVNERVAAGFTDLCQLARVHDDVFATFRGHPAMVNIIEHVTAEQGEAYLTLLREHAPDLLAPKVLRKLQRFDRRGGGRGVSYGSVTLSPNMLRYAWVHARLRHHFSPQGHRRGWAAGWKICEVGGGYGGQAAVTLALEPNVAEYVLYDQPEPVALAGHYLAPHPTLAPKAGRTPARLRTVGASEGGMSEVKAAAQDGGACDLVISNYALSELSVSLQWAYAERLVFDARRVYATVNFHHKHEAGNFGAVVGELEGRGYEVDQYAEVPQTDDQRRNTVVVAVAPPAEAEAVRPGGETADGGPAAEPAAAGMSVSQLREMRRKNKARLRALAAEEA